MPPSRGWFTAFDVPAELLDECHDAVRAARTGSPVEGLRFARAILRKARDSGDAGSIIEAHLTLANCQGVHGDFIEAAANAMDAFDFAQDKGDLVGSLNALVTLAGASGFILDSLEPAADLLTHCLRVAQELGERPLEARARNIRGVVLGNLGRFEEAYRDFEAAMTIIESGSAGTNTPLRLVTGNFAHAFIKNAAREEPQRREPLWSRAQQLVEETMQEAASNADLEGQSRLHFVMGEMSVQKGELQAALDQFTHARRLGLVLKHRSRAIDALLEIAKVHALMGDAAAALREFEKARDEANGLRPTRTLADVEARMATIHEAQGYADEATQSQARARKEASEYERESRHSRANLLEFFQRIGRSPATPPAEPPR